MSNTLTTLPYPRQLLDFFNDPDTQHIIMSDNPFRGRTIIWYWSRFHDGKNMKNKTRLYFSVCSIDKRFYYCHGPVVFGLQLRTLSIKHQHFISLCSVDWCFASLLSIASIFEPVFSIFFLTDLFIPHCYNPSAWYDWNFHLVFLFFYVCIHAIIALSDRYSVLVIFMTITVFFLGHNPDYF